MINDLFSHKIHASDLESWKRNLVKLANVFSDFDNKLFDRNRFDQALNFLSPTVARSPFRDIYSIYISILGVGHIVWSQEGWKCRLSETARRYLIGSEPKVEVFCRLQLSLFQRPDGRGQQYNYNKPRLEHNSQRITLELINQGYKICPLRLILKIFEAKSLLQRMLQDDVVITPEEIYTLVNCQNLKPYPSPSIEQVIEALKKYNRSEIPIFQGEKRFAFLEATGLIQVDYNNHLRLYQYENYELNQNRNRQIEAIKKLDSFFNDFNNCSNNEQIYEVLESGRWAEYFDACKTLPEDVVQRIGGEVIVSQTIQSFQTLHLAEQPKHQIQLPKRKKFSNISSNKSYSQKPPQYADPEMTRIIREKRNAIHDMLLQKLRKCIEIKGLEPWETDLIDIGVDIDSIEEIYSGSFPIQNTYLERQSLPYFQLEKLNSLTFIFEVKSSDNTILVDQIRKAVSQLYEYRYRYHSMGEIKDCAILVIVLQDSPTSQPWLKDYLLFDRHIAVCWSHRNRFECFEECRPILEPLITC